uniref:Prolyl 3-hydroxylase family member 4 (inactive) n=1 Tax=Neolamprologus brichardi TaxID=32507 RepID=A0A3Q4MYD4_NEOBR
CSNFCQFELVLFSGGENFPDAWKLYTDSPAPFSPYARCGGIVIFLFSPIQSPSSLCDRNKQNKTNKKPTDLCALFHNIQSNLCAQLNDLQRAVPCAHTFLQRNPEDQQMQQLMEEYKSKYDLSGYLIDHEERPYETSFLRGVKLVGLGDYSSGVQELEEALWLYFQEYDLCQAECEGITQLLPDRDFYAVIAGWYAYIDTLRCKLRCEENLTPNIGGYFVVRFVPTVYHYLQYAYYKLNDGRSAVPCAHSYFLFEPEDPVMKQNLLYYKAYSQQWGLQSNHFTPRMEAFKHYNQTIMQKKMLAFAETYLGLSDEDFLGPEEVARSAPDSPDAEFEGIGDYEESIYANWKQLKGKGDAGESDI